MTRSVSTGLDFVISRLTISYDNRVDYLMTNNTTLLTLSSTCKISVPKQSILYYLQMKQSKIKVK